MNLIDSPKKYIFKIAERSISSVNSSKEDIAKYLNA